MHTDVAVMNVSSMGGAINLVAIINKALRQVRASHMNSNRDAAKVLILQAHWVEGQSGCMVEKIVLDDRRNHVQGSMDVEGYSSEAHRISPYAPQEKGRAKQMSCTIKKAIQTLLATADAVGNFSEEPFYAVCDAHKLLPRPRGMKTSEEMLAGVERSADLCWSFAAKFRRLL